MKPRAWSNPPNPFAPTALEYLEEDHPRASVHVWDDATKGILATNDSPDVGFRFSVNPYRGCMHACAYCYARPGHEYLGFGAGTDFDTQVVVKRRAPELLREAFWKPSWRGELVVFSGVTDCYQPLEASLRLTRGCLEVCAEFRNPVGVITKSPIIERDIDVLQELERSASLSVAISLPFHDQDVARALEPGVATPRRRLRVIERLAAAGIRVGVSIAPIVPGLDDGVSRVLADAASAGAKFAGFVLLRLPGSVRPVFEQRLREALPLRADKVRHRIQETRGGKMYDSTWGLRQRGEGQYAEAIAALFAAQARKVGLEPRWPDEARPDTFRRPERAGAQLSLL
ncbi:MAG TPA: PA0069 family radical SAM protein [Myxococcaceae bacterium]|nr:PA0069 family radical SAM protein [Myxococcaceae bacterium]